MPLETATYISQLQPANPPESDPAEQGADHLRLIKAVVQQSFPNINGAVTATVKNLNSDLVPVGFIGMWSGSISAIPATWALCNGQTVAKADGSGNITTPDLQDMFVVGAGDTYAVGATGGAVSNQPTVGGTAITQAQLPSYNLPYTDPGHNHSHNDPGHSHSITTDTGDPNVWSADGGSSSPNSNFSGLVQRSLVIGNSTTGVTNNPAATGITISSGGSGQTHTHTVSDVPTLPPYYALAFIMKL
ncbi:MAG: hypothetical protein AB1508_01040 [Pseudomonadota bacterium]